jgi:hypothetical protein
VEYDELAAVVETAMHRAGTSLAAARSGEVEGTPLFRLDPADPVFAIGSWPEALDDLRVRRRKRGERLKDWRAVAPLRAISFRPAITAKGADAEGVVQVHLEHRLVRRLLSRFLSQGLVSGLSRVTMVIGPGAQPRVVLLGRLALYGPGAARLHEEIILVTAAWREAGRGEKPLKPFGSIREEATLDQLAQALRRPRAPASHISERIRRWAAQDASDLEPELRGRAEARKKEAMKDLAVLGEAEAKSLRRLLEDQRTRVAKREAEPEDLQLSLLPDPEAEQKRRDRRHWRAKLDRLAVEIESEPDRVRQGYTVAADRLETIGLVYLWPEAG